MRSFMLKMSIFALALSSSSAVFAAYASTDKVFRGGLCTATSFSSGSGVTLDAQGKLKGVSVNVAPGKTDAVATADILNGRVGVSTIGAIAKAGGTVVASPSAGKPYHALLSGITPAVAESLFSPPVPNPGKC
jgi:hypothetical protein